jgi:hypothetical protein
MFKLPSNVARESSKNKEALGPSTKVEPVVKRLLRIIRTTAASKTEKGEVRSQFVKSVVVNV